MGEIGLHKLFLLERGIPSPGELDRDIFERWLIKSRIVDQLRQEGAQFTLFDVLRDDFPPGYYALEKYVQPYFDIVMNLVPEIEAVGWEVDISLVADERGRATSKTKIRILPVTEKTTSLRLHPLAGITERDIPPAAQPPKRGLFGRWFGK